jgi:putative membrane protein
MIVKRNFDVRKVFWNIRYEVFSSLFVSVVIYTLHIFQVLEASLPFSIVSILGSALAIFIAFRNQSSYSRWWEARTLWGGIINSSRVLARLIITFTDSHNHQPSYDRVRSDLFKKDVVYKVIAWSHALRLHLRQQNDWEELKPLLSDLEYSTMILQQNKPNYLHLLSGKKIYRAMSTGILGGFDSFQMEGQLLALANYQGGCERIKNTPLPMNYQYFTKLFLYVFIFVLPFCLIGDFSKMNISYLVIPISFVITFVFAVMNKVGEINENPFENQISDIPMTALCNTIERDLREMLGETIPSKKIAKNGYLF